MQGYTSVETAKPSLIRKNNLFSWKWLKWEKEFMIIIVVLTWIWITVDFIGFNQGNRIIYQLRSNEIYFIFYIYWTYFFAKKLRPYWKIRIFQRIEWKLYSLLKSKKNISLFLFFLIIIRLQYRTRLIFNGIISDPIYPSSLE